MDYDLIRAYQFSINLSSICLGIPYEQAKMPVNAHEIYEYHTIEEDHQYPEDLISEDTIREDLNLSAINDDSDGYSDDDYDEDDISDTDEDEDEEEDEEVTKYVDTVISAWDAYNRSHASH